MESVSLSHHTVVEIAAKIPEPSMQFLSIPVTEGYFSLEFQSITRLRTVFIKQIFRAVEVAPPSPHRAVQGVG
jgi:hypothetical protein